MKYRTVVTFEGTVEADDPGDAETRAVIAVDEWLHGTAPVGNPVCACDVEPIIREVTRDE